MSKYDYYDSSEAPKIGDVITASSSYLYIVIKIEMYESDGRVKLIVFGPRNGRIYSWSPAGCTLMYRCE